MIAHAPRENSIEDKQIKIFIPYKNIQPVTLISLIGYNYLPIKVDGDFGYSKYFKKRWLENQTFINIEHDVVVYPGALSAIWSCQKELCVYNYHLPVHWKQNLEQSDVFPIGCIKISKEAIQKTQGLWDKPVMWNMCDKQLSSANLSVHQHFPSVVNANEALLGFVNYEIN